MVGDEIMSLTRTSLAYTAGHWGWAQARASTGSSLAQQQEHPRSHARLEVDLGQPLLVLQAPNLRGAIGTTLKGQRPSAKVKG
jgi:hypothetical protein